jgi:hypothetical protein
MCAYRSKAAKTILKNNLAKFLYLRSNKLNGFVRDFVPNFLRDVMLDAKSYISGDEPLSSLRKVICELFVKNCDDAQFWALNDVNNKPRFKDMIQALSAANTVNLVAIAAAARSLEALRKLANGKSKLLRSKSPAFGYPLDVAVYAGQFEVVKALVHQASIDINQTAGEIPGAGHLAFRQAICTGIEQGNRDIVQFLLNKYVVIFDPATEPCMEIWLDKAISAKDTKIARLLMHVDTHAGMSTFYTAFEKSFMWGKTRLRSVFFKLDRLQINQVFRRTYPLLTAIESYAGPHVMKRLVDLGADVDGPAYLGGLDRPLRAALKSRRDKLLLKPLQMGANACLIPQSIWRSHQEYISNTLEMKKALEAAYQNCEKPRPLSGKLFAGF